MSYPLNEHGYTVGAVSRYDLEYLKYYNPKLETTLIPSLGTFYMSANDGSLKKREEILIFKKIGSHYGAVPLALPHKKDAFIQTVKETLKPEFKGNILQILLWVKKIISCSWILSE
jgi:hypothetical protein